VAAQVEQVVCPGLVARWRRAAEALLGEAALSRPVDPGVQVVAVWLVDVQGLAVSRDSAESQASADSPDWRVWAASAAWEATVRAT
jgi:hypothetical protein